MRQSQLPQIRIPQRRTSMTTVRPLLSVSRTQRKTFILHNSNPGITKPCALCAVIQLSADCPARVRSVLKHKRLLI